MFGNVLVVDKAFFEIRIKGLAKVDRARCSWNLGKSTEDGTFGVMLRESDDPLECSGLFMQTSEAQKPIKGN